MPAITVSPEDQLAEIQRGADDVVSAEELLAKLKKSFETQTPLKIKFGADPSRPDIHIGHTVPINKLRQFQQFGHEIQFIIGDFTARIGDPTDRNKARPQLTREEVDANAATYKEQLFKILDPELTRVYYNNDWLGTLKPMDLIRLLATHTVQQVIVRDDFKKRMESNTPIHLHEFVYPLIQAYDSVHLHSDVEIGGTDQLFNLMRGRELQKSHGQPQQSLVLMPLLEGTDGVKKMSKSADNYISVIETPENMYGKTMSISDQIMPRYYHLLSQRTLSDVKQLLADVASGAMHPMAAKKALAFELTERFCGISGAKQGETAFSKNSHQETPDDLAEQAVKADDAGNLFLPAIAAELGFVKSNGEARRMIKQNGVKIDGKPVSSDTFAAASGDELVFRVGKRNIVKLIVE